MNFTFSDFGYMDYWYADTGVSSAFQGYYPRDGSGGWIEPRPETGNEMFISFYNGHATYECPLYCEKSGIFSKPFWEYDKNFLKLQGVSVKCSKVYSSDSEIYNSNYQSFYPLDSEG